MWILFSRGRLKIEENNNDTVNLIFNVNLGEKSRISKIQFIGDKKIKDRILRSE